MAGALLFVVLSTLGLSSIAAPVCSVGDSGNVLWKGKWYPATVVKVNENQSRCYIHYTGYANSWDEWVGGDRFQKTSGESNASGYNPGDAVSVKWKGQWYAASVLKVTNGKYKIHYDQYDNSWDEWVGNDRIRPR
jgi:hypothetical protein